MPPSRLSHARVAIREKLTGSVYSGATRKKAKEKISYLGGKATGTVDAYGKYLKKTGPKGKGRRYRVGRAKLGFSKMSLRGGRG